jgi:TonB family protein
MKPFRRLLGSSQGLAVSIVLHTGVALAACVSLISAPRGGGSSRGSGTGLDSGFAFSASIRGENESLDVTPGKDVAQFGRLTEDEVTTELPDPPEIAFDPFALPPGETTPVPPASYRPADEALARFSTSDRYVALPGSIQGGDTSGKGSGEFGSGIGSGGSGADTGKGDGTGKGVGNGAGDAVALYKPLPAYPNEARRKSIEGVVILEYTIEKDGACTGIVVVESSGFTSLDEAAIRAVQCWKYQPAAEAAKDRIRFVFKLER